MAFSLVKGNYAQENLFSSLAGETNMNQFDIEDQAFIFSQLPMALFLLDDSIVFFFLFRQMFLFISILSVHLPLMQC